MYRVTNPIVLRAVNHYLDEHLEQHEKVGEIFKRKKFPTSQVRNLQHIVFTATRFTAITNFVKNQIGKDSDKKYWASRENGAMVGEIVLEALDTLRKQAEKIAVEFNDSPYNVALHLTRGWVEQVVTHYLFLKARGE